MGNTTGADNMCIHGRFAPELIVIGAMVSATKSFNTALAYSPGFLFPEHKLLDWTDRNKLKSRQDGYVGGKDVPGFVDGWKNGQGHFFDVMYYKGRDWMGQAYPECTRQTRRVAVDSTSRYAQDPEVPGNIASWYGVTKGPRLRFVFILRDPLVRLHEHFWKAKTGGWCMKLPHGNFAAFVRLLLNGHGSWYTPGGSFDTRHDRCEEILGASLYTTQIKSWFWTFDPSQFTFIPFRHIVQGSSSRNLPVELVWEQLGVRGLTPPRVHANVAPYNHPSLDQEVAKWDQKRFWTYYRSYMGPLEVAELLANTSAILQGFGGERNADEVSRWLLSNW